MTNNQDDVKKKERKKKDNVCNIDKGKAKVQF